MRTILRFHEGFFLSTLSIDAKNPNRNASKAGTRKGVKTLSPRESSTIIIHSNNSLRPEVRLPRPSRKVRQCSFPKSRHVFPGLRKAVVFHVVPL